MLGIACWGHSNTKQLALMLMILSPDVWCWVLKKTEDGRQTIDDWKAWLQRYDGGPGIVESRMERKIEIIAPAITLRHPDTKDNHDNPTTRTTRTPRYVSS